jgi:hypothetical protein
VIPDGEALVIGWLDGHDDVQALDAQIVSQTPDEDDRAQPWVRVTQLDATPEANSRPEHLIEFMLQFDCYTGATNLQEDASTLNRTVRAALKDLEGRTVDGAVVTCVRVTSNFRLPDTDLEAARERYVLTADVYAHNA